MADPRPYCVLLTDGTKRLVDAKTPAKAIKHVAGTYIAGIHAASVRDVADLMGSGVKIERAGE